MSFCFQTLSAIRLFRKMHIYLLKNFNNMLKIKVCKHYVLLWNGARNKHQLLITKFNAYVCTPVQGLYDTIILHSSDARYWMDQLFLNHFMHILLGTMKSRKVQHNTRNLLKNHTELWNIFSKKNKQSSKANCFQEWAKFNGHFFIHMNNHGTTHLSFIFLC